MTESQSSSVILINMRSGRMPALFDPHVEATKALNRLFHHGFGASPVRHVGYVDDSLATHGTNSFHHRLRQHVVVSDAGSLANMSLTTT